MSKFTITVPASSANIGPGFDSAGLALNRYLTLHVEQGDSWDIKHDSPLLPQETDYKSHFIYLVATKVAKQFNKELAPCHIWMKSDIHLARGLGSSAAAVVAGISITNELCDLHLSKKEMLTIATQFEGHPDNVAPAIFGGFIVGAMLEEQNVDFIQLPALQLDMVIYIPDIELKTTDARKVLPTEYHKDIATRASSVCNVMIAALLTKDYVLAGKMMENDQFHEPYRAELIPNYETIKQKANELGAYGTVISGAGPTMISFVPQGQGKTIAKQMQEVLPTYHVSDLLIDNNGLRVK